MNEYAQLRTELKEALAKCTHRQRRTFRLMYAPSVLEDPLDDSEINTIVNYMMNGQLEWALKQVQFETEAIDLEENKKNKNIWQTDINNLTGMEI